LIELAFNAQNKKLLDGFQTNWWPHFIDTPTRPVNTCLGCIAFYAQARDGGGGFWGGEGRGGGGGGAGGGDGVGVWVPSNTLSSNTIYLQLEYRSFLVSY